MLSKPNNDAPTFLAADAAVECALLKFKAVCGCLLLSWCCIVQEGRYLTVGRSERSQGLQLLADMALQSNSR